MELKVETWGDGLALRIPSEIAHRLGLHDGATVTAQFAVDGSLSIRPGKWDRQAFARELAEARDAMPLNEPAIEAVRGEARY